MQYKVPATYAPTKYNDLEKRMIADKRRQAGIAFPAPRKQDYLLLVRLDISSTGDKKLVSKGIKKLCTFFQEIDDNILEIEDTSSEDELNAHALTKFNFTATIGFGKTFFRKLDLISKSPKNLNEMPPYHELGDKSPYVLQQTDMILQLACNNYAVNRMVLKNSNYFRSRDIFSKKDQYSSEVLESRSLDIMCAIEGWAKITDIHYGFHRADGKNLMGFYDGISNPHRLDNDIVWIPEEGGSEFSNGTYMVFQKIEHNLRDWNKLTVQEQEKWVGRSKATGLLLGTLSDDEEKRLMSELHSSDPSKVQQARIRLSQLFDEQRDPTKNFFDPYDVRYLNISKNCPQTSHARMVNPRKSNDRRAKLIFRRGCLYMEEGFTNDPKSGILFISFQNDIKIFEELKRNISLHKPNSIEVKQSAHAQDYHTQKRSFTNSFDTTTLGGGYYYVPPIPDKNISNIGQQFF